MNWLGFVVHRERARERLTRIMARAARGAALLGVLLAVVAVSRPCGATEGNLLSGKAPIRAVGAAHTARLTDGQQAEEGGAWDSPLTVRLGPSSEIVYDLGKPTPIAAAYLQADNNDEYILSGSLDGKEYDVLWVAEAVANPGLQARARAQLQGSARFVKLTARGGDSRFSVSEIQVFAEAPANFPPSVRKRPSTPLPELVRSKMLLVALGLLFWVLVTQRETRRAWLWTTALAPAFAGYLLFEEMALAWPVGAREVSFARGLCAGVAGLSLLRWVIAPKRYPANRIASMTTLGLAGVAAFFSFYNLGHPQFRDAARNEPLYVHNFDMRVYYPVAKYFPELRFDGLYQASVAAYVDDVPGVTLENLEHVELRDLRNHRMTRVRDVKDEIRSIRSRFSDPRWEEFKTDMRYFRETMGVRDYLGSMIDHGGNATPVWLALAHVIFSGTTASNPTLWWTGMLDPVLILLALLVIGRTFGIRTMLVSAVVFGANDFYMFGSNWGGATLRHDWMAYLAMGICALKVRRPALGGGLLALSALIRAFPALALVGLAIPVAWSIVERYRETGRVPALQELRDAHREFIRAVAGAVVCVLAFFLFASLLFGFDAWPEWFAKVRLLDSTPHTNHVSLKALIAGSTHLQATLLQERAIIFAACALLIGGIIVVLGRRQPLDQAALLGSLMIPVVFNPANYYIHFIFVLPMLARERRQDARAPYSLLDSAVLWSLLAICVAQYWTTLVKDYDLHFQMATAIYFAGITGLFASLLRREWLAGGLPWLDPPPVAAGIGSLDEYSEAPSSESDDNDEYRNGLDEPENDADGELDETGGEEPTKAPGAAPEASAEVTNPASTPAPVERSRGTKE